MEAGNRQRAQSYLDMSPQASSDAVLRLSRGASLPQDTQLLTMQARINQINAIGDSIRQQRLAADAMETSGLYADGAGDVRTLLTLSDTSAPLQRFAAEPLSPLARALTMEVEVPPSLAAVGRGAGDLVAGGILGAANMTVLPLADTVQAGLKFLHGSATGDYQPLNSLSTFGAPDASTWDGVKSTAVNIFNVSPAGMVYHSYAGARDATTALMNGDLRRATSEGLGLGLNFAGARAVGMGDYGFTITDVRGAGMGRGQVGAIGIKFGKLADGQGATFGRATSNDYRATFFAEYPELNGKVVVHHAVEQQALTRYPGVVSAAEMHSLENLRGIPKETNSQLHLSEIRREWNRFYRENPTATQAQLLAKATEIDAKYGIRFSPPVESGN